MLAWGLVAAAIAWPLVAGVAVWQRVSSAERGAPVWTMLVYAAAGHICHQRPERSFHTHGVAWPVCARCSGLYLAAAPAALLACGRRRSKVPGGRVAAAPGLRPMWMLAFAAMPTALTVLWEWGGLGAPANLWRFATALPLGAAIAVVVIGVVSHRPPSESIG